jgi:predicted nucleotidyltransferase
MNKHIFDEIQSLKRQLIPDDRLILFGSQARGDARENSDWDLLAILNSEKRSWRKNFNQYVYPFSEIGDKYDTCVNLIVRNKKDWETRPSLLKYNVEQEGIEIE